MKLKAMVYLLFSCVLVGCSGSYIVDEHVISTDGEHRLFEIDRSFEFVGYFDYTKVNSKNNSVLSTNHTKVKVFLSNGGEIILAQLSNCSNCDFNLDHKSSKKLNRTSNNKKDVMVNRQDISDLYKLHPTYISSLNRLLPLSNQIDNMTNHCFDYYERPQRRSNVKVGILESCDVLTSTKPIKKIQVM